MKNVLSKDDKKEIMYLLIDVQAKISDCIQSIEDDRIDEVQLKFIDKLSKL